MNGSQRGKPYEYIDYKDVLKIKELATELTLRCKNFVKKLSAADRYDLKKDVDD